MKDSKNTEQDEKSFSKRASGNSEGKSELQWSKTDFTDRQKDFNTLHDIGNLNAALFPNYLKLQDKSEFEKLLADEGTICAFLKINEKDIIENFCAHKIDSNIFSTDFAANPISLDAIPGAVSPALSLMNVKSWSSSLLPTEINKDHQGLAAISSDSLFSNILHSPADVNGSLPGLRNSDNDILGADYFRNEPTDSILCNSNIEHDSFPDSVFNIGKRFSVDSNIFSTDFAANPISLDAIPGAVRPALSLMNDESWTAPLFSTEINKDHQNLAVINSDSLLSKMLLSTVDANSGLSGMFHHSDNDILGADYFRNEPTGSILCNFNAENKRFTSDVASVESVISGGKDFNVDGLLPKTLFHPFEEGYKAMDTLYALTPNKLGNENLPWDNISFQTAAWRAGAEQDTGVFLGLGIRAKDFIYTPTYPVDHFRKRQVDSTLITNLKRINPKIIIPIEGAKIALYSDNPDNRRHVFSSLRVAFEELIAVCAPDYEVKQWTNDTMYYRENGKPTRRGRLTYIFRFCYKNVNVNSFIKAKVELIEYLQVDVHNLTAKFTFYETERFLNEVESVMIFISDYYLGNHSSIEFLA